MRTILGIDVDDELVVRWRQWFAPAIQPFKVPAVLRVSCQALFQDPFEISPEVRDTFMVYSHREDWVLLDEQQFDALSPDIAELLAQSQARGERATWWPDTLAVAGDQPIIDFIEEGVPASRHDEVSEATWRQAADVVPDARRLAGHFPSSSGPNCFGAVMGACGVEGAENEWMHQPPFEAWLAENAVPFKGGGLDDKPGVVYVWRDHDGLAQHACVSVGDGWVVNKPSQAWYSPRVIWPTKVALKHSSYDGVHLERHVLRPPC